MALTIKQIDERMEVVYKQFKDRGMFNHKLLFIREIYGVLLNDLNEFDQREGKKLAKKKDQEKDKDKLIENQVKMNKALRMNNPLWDVE